MSSPVASTFTSKISKNPGLTIDLKADKSRKLSSNLHSFTRQLPSAISSLPNTPALEPDCIDRDDAFDCDEVQYIYITSDSPFYCPPVDPRSSSYITVSGFRFACDSLAEEDSFAESNSNESDSESDDINVMIVDADLTEELDSQPSIEWKFTETLEVKPARTDDEALRSIF